MRFFTAIVSVAAVAAVTVAPSALAKGKHGKDISEAVEAGLHGIELGVKGLGDSFKAFLADGKPRPELTDAGIAAGKKLSAALSGTTKALDTQHTRIKKSQADDIAELWGYLAGNISFVAKSVRQNQAAIEKVKQTRIVTETLPAYETEFELLGKALAKKIGKKELHGIKKSAKVIDNQLECTLKTYGLKDESTDKNTIARRGKHAKKHTKDICSKLDL